ncbi:MliC family protein [Sandaracinobacteroides hominis]|uniref:MliC family protein n=1 Tax=Sandaracinobacteroides hominis TaxID=2780086 RepID=UPI0018F6A9E2|nr:MliC family protein [Sandaracinobacteroides hominis]
MTGALLLIAACAPKAPPPPPPPPPPPMQQAPAEMRVNYSCTNGEQVTVRYFPQQGVGTLVRGGQNIELQQQSSPPGFLYIGAHTVLRVQEDRLRMTMTVGNMAATNCTAI